MTRKMIGRIHVDSGQIFIVDPSHLNHWEPGAFDPDVEPDNSYARVTTSVFNSGDGEVEKGVIVATKQDGYYPIYIVEDEHGYARKIEIDL